MIRVDGGVVVMRGLQLYVLRLLSPVFGLGKFQPLSFSFHPIPSSLVASTQL